MGKTYQQRPHESLPDFRARCAKSEVAKRAPAKPVRVRSKPRVRTNRNANRIDGFDRDDIGESPDH